MPDAGDPGQRDLLRGYVRAFEAHDIDALVALPAKDVLLIVTGHHPVPR